MEKLLNCCLNVLIISLLCCIFACHQEPKLYKKNFLAEEKIAISKQLMGGLSSYYQGDVPEQFLCEESIKLNPTFAEGHRELGIPFLKRGLPENFEKHYKNVVKYDAVEWQGWRGYIYLYFYRDYERALADFTALDTLTPNFIDYPQSTSVLFMSAICHLKMGNYDQAIDFFDQHITEELRTSTEDFIDTRTYLFHGIAYYKKGNRQQAKASFQRGLKNLNENADLWYWMAKMAHEDGEKEEALSALQNTQVHFDAEYYNHRPYVEEFFQIHQSDIDDLKRSINDPVLN